MATYTKAGRAKTGTSAAAPVYVVTASAGVSIAFDAAELGNLVSNPVWTQIDDPDETFHVASWSVRRGRSSEFDRMETGTATIKINDVDGAFDPTNTTGPFYGLLDPMKQAALALWNPVTEVTKTVFRGFVAEWLYDMDPSQRVTWTTLELSDAFDMFAATLLQPGDFGGTSPVGAVGDVYLDEDTATDAVQTRLNALLTSAEWSPGLREIFTGNVGILGTVAARNDSLLSCLLDAADADFPGVVSCLMSKEGNFLFHGRYARFNPDDANYHIAHWKAGDGFAWQDDSTIAPISGLQFRRSKLDIINQVSAIPQGANDADAILNTNQDLTSIGIYGVRGESYENLLTLNGDASSPPHTPVIPTTALEETYKFAEYYVQNYASPRTRATSVTFRSHEITHPNAEALWALICGVEISDIVTLTTTHPGGGGFNEDFFVEGISYDVAPLRPDLHDVTLTLDLSPTAYYTNDPFPPQT